ncbi:MAG: hypothetical protein RSD33_10035 [Clostridium sp.]
MFVKQINLKEALELAGKGMEVKVLAPEVPKPKEWTDYFPDTLQNRLSGCLFFRGEAAMINPEFEAAVQDRERVIR